MPLVEEGTQRSSISSTMGRIVWFRCIVRSPHRGEKTRRTAIQSAGLCRLKQGEYHAIQPFIVFLGINQWCIPVRAAPHLVLPAKRRPNIESGGKIETAGAALEYLPAVRNRERSHGQLVCSFPPPPPRVVLVFQRRREEVFRSGEARPLAAD